jgi:hypothetical protein
VGQENAETDYEEFQQPPSTVVTSMPSLAPSPKPVACLCGRVFKNHDTYGQHRLRCGMNQQQTRTHLQPMDATKVYDLKPSMSSAAAAGGPAPFRNTTAKNVQCTRGQSFAHEKQLNKIPCCSKTNEMVKSRSVSKSTSVALGSVPFTARNASPNPLLSASGPLPDVISSPMLLKASLTPYTYGQTLEIERALNVHKRDFHERSNQVSTRSEQMDASLISSFASLELRSAAAQDEPSVAGCICQCGRSFTSHKLLIQHKDIMRRCAWSEKGGARDKKFKTPRPHYQKDEYLHELAALHARQYSSEG